MAALMRYRFTKRIYAVCVHNMHFSSESTGVSLTNEMKNPKDNAGAYFRPRKRQKSKSRIGVERSSSLYGVKQLHEIAGDQVNELVDSKSAAGIEKTQTIFLEGERMIGEAVKAGVQLKSVYATDVNLLERLGVEGISRYLTNVKTLKYWVSKRAVTSEGIICAVAQKPNLSKPRVENPLPVTVVIDRISDPWTAGVLLRTAYGVGCKKLITTKGCCNMWDQDVLTASEGTHFHMPIQTNLTWKDLNEDIEATDSNVKVVLTGARPMVYRGIWKAEKKFLETNCDEDSFPSDSDFGEQMEESNFPLTNFSDIDFRDADDIVLIISDDMSKSFKQKFRFLQQNTVVLASVPVANGLAKLNPIVPGILLMYEIHSQMSINNKV